jgi:guanylate kinase
MIIHICNKCGKVFNKKSTYNYCINNKKFNERYQKLKNTIVSKVNYIQLCDLEYLDDL